MAKAELAERFFKRFSGLDRGHGKTVIPKENSPNGKKVEAQSGTVHDPPTVNLWRKHLAGEYGLGIIPIRDDATCCFGAIDIDKYDKDLKVLAGTVAQMQLPLVVCQSKSGGPHLFLFTREDAPAELVRGKLMDWAIALGYSGTEVFPKQTRLASKNDYGNWINMPYFNAAKTTRYAIAPGGKRLTAEEFLDLADTMAVTVKQLEEVETPQDETVTEYFQNGPPCLHSLMVTGKISKGSRNNGLFDIGVYLKRRWGDSFPEKLDEYNSKFIDPPLGHKEVAGVVKSLNKKDYEYRCREDPIASVCNRQICITRKYGVGQGEGDPGVVLGPLVKLESNPPMWIWDVNGARVELTTAELKDQARFHTRCIDVLNVWPDPVKAKRWSEIIREKLEEVDIQPVPPDATLDGQVWAMLEDYCTGRATARKKEELLLHKPWTDTDDEKPRTYFSSTHFRQYLEQQRVRLDSHKLWAILRKRGAEPHFFNIKGRGINVWSVPAFMAQSEDFHVPKVAKDEEL